MTEVELEIDCSNVPDGSTGLANVRIVD